MDWEVCPFKEGFLKKALGWLLHGPAGAHRMRDSLLDKTIAGKVRFCAEPFCMAGEICTLQDQHE